MQRSKKLNIDEKLPQMTTKILNFFLIYKIQKTLFFIWLCGVRGGDSPPDYV